MYSYINGLKCGTRKTSGNYYSVPLYQCGAGLWTGAVEVANPLVTAIIIEATPQSTKTKQLRCNYLCVNTWTSANKQDTEEPSHIKQLAGEITLHPLMGSATVWVTMLLIKYPLHRWLVIILSSLCPSAAPSSAAAVSFPNAGWIKLLS